MESSLTNACTIKIEKFEGPFDLLFHLIEKNQVNIYDIPVNEITDQYMEYLYAMQQLDLEIASEFILMASTLLYIKSRMLLPEKKEKKEEEVDPRDELVSKLIEYKMYKEVSNTLKVQEQKWSRAFCKLPEVIELQNSYENLELNPIELKNIYSSLLEKNKRKMNSNSEKKMIQILSHEKVSLKSKIREVIKNLINRTNFKFTELFSNKTRSRLEIVTGFLAILELTRMNKVKLEQKKHFEDIYVYRKDDNIINY